MIANEKEKQILWDRCDNIQMSNMFITHLDL